MRIALAQLNPTVGDLSGNLDLLRQVLQSTADSGIDLLVLPELFLTGYPPRDLLDRPDFVDKAEKTLAQVAELSSRYAETGILLGAIGRSQSGRPLRNCAYLFAGGNAVFSQAKTLLPSYDVFDETRYFEPAGGISVLPFKGEILGISICEDAWNPDGQKQGGRYSINPLAELKQQGATLLINLSASPYHLGKEEIRAGLLQHQCRQLGLPLIMVNQVGGNDELIFDGGSLLIDAQGSISVRLPQFKETVLVVEPGKTEVVAPEASLDRLTALESALVLGIRDYFGKCGFKGAVIGLSGGIDSALTATLAVKALGPEQVRGLTMPSPYSSGGSVADSLALAANLGIVCETLPISDIFQSFRTALGGIFAGRPEDLAEENLQARIRGNLLMAIANKFNLLLLATGNKSEMAVGYCTLYGDMCGALAPISDLPKGLVYELARHLNRERELIPIATLTKEPSAELRPDQKDSDSLPPYETLDRILDLYVDEALDKKEIILETGFDSALVERVIMLVKRNEYKRRQAPPGLKISPKAFGCGRRMPIAARF